MSRDPLEPARPPEADLPETRDIDPADIPTPEHHVGIPAAPSTTPPEPPVVPSDAEVASFWVQNKAMIILIGAVVIVALFVFTSM